MEQVELQIRSWHKQNVQPRVLDLKPSTALWINERFTELTAEGKVIYRLGLGKFPFPVPHEVLAALIEHASEKDYLSVCGLTPLREAICYRMKRYEGVASPVNEQKLTELIHIHCSKEISAIDLHCDWVRTHTS